MAVRTFGKSVIERVWLFTVPEPNTGCWLWLARIDRAGYGRLQVGGKKLMAHRVAYESLVGPLPPDKPYLDHLCRVRSCVNPDHLEPVTFRENVLRGISPAADCARKQTCVHGHPLSGPNTRIDKRTGARVCRVCQCANQRRAVERRRKEQAA